ncbi:MAG: acetyltransferase, partial [Mycobacterium sp.]
MSARIMPLRLEAFEHLPKHARRCVFWEVDPAILDDQGHLADPEFEKEAWLSMVMLEWGCCGQVAIQVADRDPGAAADDVGVAADDPGAEQQCLGYI